MIDTLYTVRMEGALTEQSGLVPLRVRHRWDVATLSRVKLELADYLKRSGKGTYNLADCEIKSNWIRHRGARAKHSLFLGLSPT